jgi:hypothetical protein
MSMGEDSDKDKGSSIGKGRAAAWERAWAPERAWHVPSLNYKHFNGIPNTYRLVPVSVHIFLWSEVYVLLTFVLPRVLPDYLCISA